MKQWNLKIEYYGDTTEFLGKIIVQHEVVFSLSTY
jgi:hypothetical protein